MSQGRQARRAEHLRVREYPRSVVKAMAEAER